LVFIQLLEIHKTLNQLTLSFVNGFFLNQITIQTHNSIKETNITPVYLVGNELFAGSKRSKHLAFWR
jgi:hypothetical protein